MERGLLLWLPGVPIPVILLLWLFSAADQSRQAYLVQIRLR